MKRLFLFILFSVSIATTATETAHSSQQVLTRTFSNVLSYISDNKRIIEAWETMAPVLEADAELGAAFFEAYAPLFESYKIEVTGAWKAAIRKFLSNLDQSTHIGRNLTEKEQDAFTRFNNYWLKTFEVEQQQKAWRKIIRSTAGVAIIAAAALYYFGYFNTKKASRRNAVTTTPANTLKKELYADPVAKGNPEDRNRSYQADQRQLIDNFELTDEDKAALDSLPF